MSIIQEDKRSPYIVFVLQFDSLLYQFAKNQDLSCCKTVPLFCLLPNWNRNKNRSIKKISFHIVTAACRFLPGSFVHICIQLPSMNTVWKLPNQPRECRELAQVYLFPHHDRTLSQIGWWRRDAVGCNWVRVLYFSIANLTATDDLCKPKLQGYLPWPDPAQ